MSDGPAARARALACRLHESQRYGDEPYVRHLEDVAALVRPWGEEARAVAWLHDVLEDTPTPESELVEVFGPRITACVRLVTDEPGPDRRERKRATMRKLAECPPELEMALVVKAADRLANLRACRTHGRDDLLRMYRREHEAFRAAAFRPGLCDAFWDEMRELTRSRGSPPGPR